MCGIAGKIYFGEHQFNKSQEVAQIQKTIEILHHRGPDSSGYMLDGPVWLASTRLSIIDLSAKGNQPMVDEKSQLAIVFNGEIYNFLEIKEKLKSKYKFNSGTDTEVLLRLYQEYGVKCLDFLRGMFAFAVWDGKKKQLFLARDKIGKKPLKYYFTDKFFIFASELKAFVDHPGVKKEIDWKAVNYFLSYQYVPPPLTGFKGIYKLPPAHYMIVGIDGKLAIKQYWDVDFSQKEKRSETEWINFLDEKLNESVALRLRSDVPLGIQLSGGIDSSLVSVIASKLSGKKLNTFSVGFLNSPNNELEFAQIIAHKINSHHHEIMVKPNIENLLDKLVYQFEEPFADPSIIPTWYLMNESSKTIKVALNGDGGDENFAGYQRYKTAAFFKILKCIPMKKEIIPIIKLINSVIKKRKILTLLNILSKRYDSHNNYYKDVISFIDANRKKKLLTEEFNNKFVDEDSKFFENDKLNIYDEMLYFDLKNYLPGVLLAKSDIASMAFSLEVRSPLLDTELIDLCAKIPFDLKLKGTVTKYLLKKLALKYLPSDIIYRKKQGFIPPVEQWMRNEWFNYAKDQLSDKKLLALNIFRKNELMDLIYEHKYFKLNNAYAIWNILMFKNWLNVFFDS